ncbi:hypothetical protein CAEBREN_28447 [Caenorhabditis brenneri]|uniref:Uncharacterized protein n=1 Tax=Caenorhabditis brenneri TaxID=135651 RepID=G0P344_CAEBE|nr:hypothetical protein CAEBREN_28447 [Caenorhabditis brenneri]
MAPPKSPSGHIRSEIGLSKKRLLNAIDDVSEISNEAQLKDLTTESVYEEIVEICIVAQRIRMECDRLDKLQSKWKSMIDTDDAEKLVYEDYLQRVGDFRLTVTQGREALIPLQTLYNKAVDLHKLSSTTPTDYPFFDDLDTSIPSSAEKVPEAAPPVALPWTDRVLSNVAAPVPMPPTISYPPMSQSNLAYSTQNTTVFQPSQPSIPTNLAYSATQQTTVFPPSQAPTTVFPPSQAPTTVFPPSQASTTVFPPSQAPMQSVALGTPYILDPFNIQLPPIKLPTFGGDHVEFRTFMELFTHLIDSKQLTPVIKFHYLLSSLNGEAKQRIQHLPLIAENYPVALHLLYKSYGNSTLTQHHLFRQLMVLPTVAFTQDPEEVLQFWNSASTIFYQLRNINISFDNVTTTSLITSKLPKRYVEKLYHGDGRGIQDTSTLLTTLHTLLQADVVTNTIFKENKAIDKRVTTMSSTSKMDSHRHSHGSVSGSKFAANRSSNRPLNSPCVFCATPDSFHKHAECPTYPDGKARFQRALELRLCFRCLRLGHSGKTCERKRPCFLCRGGHHSSLCRNQDGRSHDNQRQTSQQSSITPSRGNSQSRGTSQSRENSQTRGPSPAPHHPMRYGQSPAPDSRNRSSSTSNIRSSRSHSPNNNMRQDRRVQFGTPATTHAAVSIVTPSYVPPSMPPLMPPSLPPSMTSSVFVNTTHNTLHATEPIVQQSEETLPSNDCSSSASVAMMAAKIFIEDSEGKQVETTAFFDTGSDRSYISQELASTLQLQHIDQQNLVIQTFASSSPTTVETVRLLVKLHAKDRVIPVPLTVIPKITNTINMFKVADVDMEGLLNDPDLVIPRITTQPGILIGLDFMAQVLGNSSSKTLANGTMAHFTDCGIIITGKEQPPVLHNPAELTFADELMESTTDEGDINDPYFTYFDQVVVPYEVQHFFSAQSESKGILTHDVASELAALRDLVQRFYHVDTSGIHQNPRTSDEEWTAQYFDATTYRLEDGRYCCRWPFKDGSERLPDNRYLAYFRLQSTIRRLEKDPKLMAQYADIFADQMKRGFIEIVPNEAIQDGPVVHYISHHPVIKTSSKTTKMRIVYDASARSSKSSESLNDVLHTGESLLPKILGILLRSRIPEILMSADIEKAFLTIALDIADRDACRFLWTPPGDTEPTCYRFQRVPFGVKTSPYLLNAVVKKHMLTIDNEFSQPILRNIYVDNVFYGVDNVDQGIQFFKMSKEMFASAKMNLTQFFSNCPELNQVLSQLDNNTSPIEAEQKILGVHWNILQDSWSINQPTTLIGSDRITKRLILKLIASFYDPLGMLAPVVLKGKLFFQTLWDRQLGWDSADLTAEELKQWRSIESS